MNDLSLSHFVSGQVLGAKALNGVVSYLEGQDRASRRALSGIGVVCGFDVDARGATVHISRGVAVTSQGYLITAEAQDFDRFRRYVLPESDAEETTDAQADEERYPFFFDAGDNQIDLFELVDADFVPAPGEENPEPLTADMLSRMAVMLFLECRLESLKSCDMNDCSDKGAELRFTLRRLLLSRDDADAILAREAAIAGHPVDRATHPMNDLVHLRLEKLKIAAKGINNYGALMLRIVAIGLKLAQHLPQALRDARDAYGYLVGDLWPEGEDIFPPTYFSNVWGQLAGNIFLAQYFYDYMRDVVMAYNEFVAAAARYEQECLPNPGRFPRHVLIGDAVPRPDAVTTTFPTPASVLNWDPAALDTGAGLQVRVAARRTHFVPSPAHTHDPRREEVRSLFLRLHQLALAYRTTGLAQAPLRLTPSKTGDAPLSDRAMPFYYDAQPGGVLHLNWSYRKTRSRLLNTVYAYQFSAPDNNHPLHFRLDGQDFIRVEGIVGKPLGTAMAQLVAWKHELGLSFSIVPVFMALSTGADDVQGDALDKEAQRQALAAARQLLLCRLSDVDIVFMIVIRAIFAFLVQIVDRLNKLPQDRPPVSDTNDFTMETIDALPNMDILAGRSLFAAETAARFALNLPPAEVEEMRLRADTLREEIIARPFSVEEITTRIAGPAKDGTIGALFKEVSDPRAGGNLFDRTRDRVLSRGGDARAALVNYAPVELMSRSIALMDTLSVDSLADFDAEAFGTQYNGFARAYVNYADTVRAAPSAAPEVVEMEAVIVSSADTVASQAGAFAAANVNTEIMAALKRIFESLTLGGYARQHPGLEHHAGVPVGGTLVLAYVSVAALLRQAAAIGVISGPDINKLAANVIGNGEPATEESVREVTAARAFATADPLDQFIVLADFCLPYQCCDADCSDRYIERRFRANPFGPNSNPGPMGVPPFDAGAPAPGDGRGDGGGGGGVVRFPRPDLVRQPLDRVFVDEVVRPGGIRLPSRDTLSVRETDTTTDRVTLTERVAGGDALLDALRRASDRDRDDTRPDEERTETPLRDGAPALLHGIVARKRGSNPVPGTEVILMEAGAAPRRVPTEDGSFKIPVRPGMLAVGAASPELQGTMTTLHLEPGEEHEIVLTVTKKDG